MAIASSPAVQPHVPLAADLRIPSGDPDRSVAEGGPPAFVAAAPGLDLRAMARTMIEAQEAERGRIARDLHDIVGQALTVVRLSVVSVRDLLSEAPAQGKIEEALVALDHALHTVRSFAGDLRPPVLDDLGLEAAVRSSLNRVGRNAGFEAVLTSSNLPAWLDPQLEITCFRVFQEAMTNVTRHARASRVEVVLRFRRQTLELVVQDNGAGFDVQDALRGAERGESLGLTGMSERARMLGGSLLVRSWKRRGTRVSARFPVGREVSLAERDAS